MIDLAMMNIAPLAGLRLGDAGYWGVTLAFLLGALAFWLYRRQLHDVGPMRKALLPSLRALAVTAIALIIAQPSLFHSQTFEQRGQVIVLSDTSASMGVGDPQASASRKLLTAAALNFTDTSGFNWTVHELAERIEELRVATAETLKDGVTVAGAPVADGEADDAVDIVVHLETETADIASALAELEPSLVSSAEMRGSALMEIWNEIPGRRVADIQWLDVFDRPPDSFESIASLRLPTDVGDDFVRRIRGRLHPPENGVYTFHIAADTSALLLVSRDEDPEGVRPVMTVTQRTEPEDLSQASSPVQLEAGRAYAFELHHKEGEHADHLMLAWSRDGGEPAVIAAADLSSPAGLVDPETRRDELAQAFEEEVARPAAELAPLAIEARQDAMRQLVGALTDWENELRAIFDAHAADQLARGNSEAAAAAAAFDAMVRSQRRDAIISPEAAERSLSATLEETADVEVREASGAAEAAQSEGTDLVAALSSVEPSEERPQAVVLLSDGRHNTSAAPAEVAAALGRRGVSVYPVLIGSPRPPPDLAVLEVAGPAAVHKEDQVTGRIVLMDAMPPGKPFTLRIGDGEVTLWEEDLETTGRGRREIEFAFKIDKAAELRLPPEERGARLSELLLPLSVEVEAVEGEMQADNNVGDLPVRVTLATGRLLIVDGRPRWETRYLASLLGRDRRWQIQEVLGPTLRGNTLPRGEGGFPETREELFEYDVIVLGEVPLEWWEGEELQWLADFVDERGGGLIVVDGVRGLLQDYEGTPIDRLLPVMREAGTPMRIASLSLTPAGQQRDALRLEPEVIRNNELWPTLPPPRWVMPVSPLPGGEVLVEASTEDGSRLPAIVASRVGRGRVWYQAFDETWRWRKDAENRWQSRYWSGVANRIMEPPFSAEDRFVSLGVEQAAVEPGEKVAVRARLRDAEGRPLSGDAAAAIKATAVLLKDGAPVADARLEPDASGGGLFRAELQAPRDAGVYEVAVAADRYSDADLSARAGLLVRRPIATGELARLDADEALMRQLAEASGGRFLQEYEAGELPKLLSGLHRSTTVTSKYDIWTSWPLFGLAICLLGVEWLIRRRTGML